MFTASPSGLKLHSGEQKEDISPIVLFIFCSFVVIFPCVKLFYFRQDILGRVKVFSSICGVCFALILSFSGKINAKF